MRAYFDSCDYEENSCEYVFSTSNRPHRQLRPSSIGREIKRISDRVSISKSLTPHVFRHTMATTSLNNGIELADLQSLLGHVYPSTTLRYAKVSEKEVSVYKTCSKNIIVATDNNFNIYYYSGFASGVETLYLPTLHYTSFYDKFNLVYQNKSNLPIRLYDAVISAEFDMLIDGTLNNCDFPFNVTNKSYLVEVESSVSCGKVIFIGNVVTEIYKTGNPQF